MTKLSPKEIAQNAPKGIARGLNKGHVVTKRVAAPKYVHRHNGPSKHKAIVSSVVRDALGFAPYERRLMEIIKGGGNNPQKRAYKFAKNRLGTHLRAKKKVKFIEEMLSKATVKK